MILYNTQYILHHNLYIHQEIPDCYTIQYIIAYIIMYVYNIMYYCTLLYNIVLHYSECIDVMWAKWTIHWACLRVCTWSLKYGTPSVASWSPMFRPSELISTFSTIFWFHPRDSRMLPGGLGCAPPPSASTSSGRINMLRMNPLRGQK